MTTIGWPLRGRFSLDQAIHFGFGHTAPTRGEVMRLAFVLDGHDDQAGVAVTQPGPDRLEMTVTGGADPERAAAQAARVLSADVDASSYDALVDADPLLTRVQAARPGLRPVLFHSAYEALCWSVLSARRPASQMAEVRAALARDHGRVLEVAGEQVAAFPTPQQLLAVTAYPAVPDVKLARMHAIAEAALAGELDTATLRAAPAEETEQALQRFAGIGPFYAQLVTVRALGHTDVLPGNEPRVVRATGDLLGRGRLDQEGFAAVAEAWRPWRTWACVAVRAAGDLVS